MAKEKNPKEGLEVEEIVSKSERFIQQNSKKIIIAIVGILVIVAAILGIKYGYMIPQEKKASAAIFRGEQYFAADSFNLALHGNGADFQGFEAIAKSYGSTKSGNLAKAYSGICYFRLGETQKALDMLKSFKGEDNMISPAITGLIGDCYVNLGNTKEGVTYFEKAAKEADNDVVSPIYLKKAGVAYESMKDYASALKAYKQIKEKYYMSSDITDIDKYIDRATALAK